LNNILATPTMLGNNDSFTVQDLLPITQIYVTNISSSTFNSLDGVTVTFTVVDENGVIDNATNPKVYLPLIKVKNRLDTAYFSTGEPFFFGGDGPNATYYDSDKIVRNPESLVLNFIYQGNKIVLSAGRLYRTALEATTSVDLTHTSGTVNGFTYVADYDSETVFLNEEFDAITNENVTLTDNFWEQGQFIYGNKVQNSFISLFGGVGWEGFFKPVVSGISRFWLRTTGSTVFKFQDPESPSFQSLLYGSVNSQALTADGSLNGISSDLYNRVTAAYNDPSRQLVEVTLEEPLLLKDSDELYIEVNEGPLIPKQYSIFTYYTEPTLISKFFVEVTTDFNRKNIQANNLPLATYRGTARYLPYERRTLKTYLNSIYHKLEINNTEYTITSATTFTCSEFEYYHIMINDYIYDYRRRLSDSTQGVRRWRVTSLSDSTRTVTVELDTTYTSVNVGNYNDQQAYIGSGNSVVFTNTGTPITTTYTTGSLTDQLDSNSVTFLYFVGRYGEITARQKYITITQFLENYVDYAFDWLYYTKDEDVDPSTQNKAWILWYRPETSGTYGPLNYKYLYDKNYEFYQIGDFKTFLDNSVPGGGTSRDAGIDQRAFGKEQLDTKGDQYNTLFSLLPVRSEYSPPVKWNDVAISRTFSLTADSRLVGLSDNTSVELGNYLFRNTDNGFISGDIIPYRTRINEILLGSSAVISSRNSSTSGSFSGYIFDHRGFVTAGVITSISANKYQFYGEASEIQQGMCIVTLAEPNNASYNRVTRIDPDAGFVTLTLERDIANVSSTIQGPFTSSSNASFPTATYGWFTRTGGVESDPYSNVRQLVIRWNGVTLYDSASSTIPIPSSGGITLADGYTYYPGTFAGNSLYGWSADYNNAFAIRRETIGGSTRCAIYYDRGVDITKPLETFCTGTACGQNRYEGEDAVAEHIALFVGKGVISGNDTRWTSPQNGATTILNNNQAQVSEWRDYQPNIMLETNITAKTYRSNAIYAKLTGTGVGAQLAELGHPNFPLNTYVPIAHIEAMVRIKGEIWDGTNDKIKTATTGFSGSVANFSSFNVTLSNIDDLESGSYVYVNGRYCTVIAINTSTKVVTLRNESGATRTFSVPNNGTLTFGNQVYYFIARLSDSWQSLYDFDTTDDGIQVGKRLDFTKFASSDWNVQFLAFPTRQDQYYTNGSNINALSTITSYYNSFASYRDRFFEITADITLTATELAYFLNPTSFAPLTGTTYVLPIGSYIFFSGKAGDKIVWFSKFDDFQGDYSCYSLHPTYTHTTSPGNLSTSSENNLGDLKNQNLISLQPQDGPAFEVLPQGSTDPLDMPFRYLHYRRKQYELLPLHYNFENTFKALRLLNPRVLDSYTNVENTLQNSVNKLSVFTFANDTENRELCCPPLDTSPPFDSSPIGLSTTSNEPDMSIGGLVNVRSITATHPQSKIHNIPSGFSNSSLDVDKKLEIVFGGATYDLLIADTKPF
jgi:hypothetical protein